VLSGVSLRAATAADVPSLTELVRAAYAHYVPRIGGPPRPMTDDYAEVVRTQRVIVALRGGQILGLVVLGVSDEGFFVDNVAVDPSHQGIGVGKALLEHAESAARDAGFDSIHLYTHERMTENLALYSRIGYVEYDRRMLEGTRIVYLQEAGLGTRGKLDTDGRDARSVIRRRPSCAPSECRREREVVQCR
jgi:ribosomal protein S18 acetylase RimI-like enzyme